MYHVYNVTIKTIKVKQNHNLSYYINTTHTANCYFSVLLGKIPPAPI